MRVKDQLKKSRTDLILDVYFNKNYDETYRINEQVVTVLQKNSAFLNNLLKLLKIDGYDVTLYIHELIKYLEEIGEYKPINFVMDEFESEYTEICMFPSLKEKYIRSTLKLLKYENYQDKGKEEITDIIFIDFLKSDRIIIYYVGKALTAIMEKEQALKYFQDFIDSQIKEDSDINFTVEKVEYILEGAKYQYGNTHHFAAFVRKEGTACWKAGKCMWHEIMKDLDDVDFAYTVACHGDFAMAKKFNANFVLTRTQTLMQGSPYCDFCWHDLREVSAIKHPPKEIWDSIK